MKRVLAALAAALLLAIAAIVALNLRDEDGSAGAHAPPAGIAGAEIIERGRYLALAGNCAGCHSLPGAPAFAGGLGIPTPFGTVFAGNLTRDPQTGLGDWSAGDFWRAMHNGRSRDGRLLYPAFPYTSFTRITRADSDALFAYLQSVPPAAQANRPHELPFPYNTQAALAVWRALYFRPGVFEPDATRGAEWNRGAYLVRGPGHCNACHAPRGRLGGIDDTPELKGGLIPRLNWFAPALGPAAGITSAADQQAEWVALLKTGRSAHRSASGPMAEVVFNSTQHLLDADIRAMTVFMATLPPPPAAPPRQADPPAPALLKTGQALYKDRCAACHGDEGQGAIGAYPALAGNPTVLMEPAANAVRIVLEGGFLPATAGNPRPHGMPPFAQSLSNAEVAAVLSHVRNAWGNQAAALSELDVARYR
jgi:mono/diheme cytochrome c family protein